MSFVTFHQFKTDIFTLVFPDGMAEVRVPLFRNFLVNALLQMQTYCESYQLLNVNFYGKENSWDDCGISIIQGCRGRYGAVYAFDPSCRCQRYFFEAVSLEKMSCLYERCRCSQSQICCGQTVLSSASPYTQNQAYCGDYVGGEAGCLPPHLAAMPEDPCSFKLSDRYYAVGPNQKIWLYPRWPCGWILGTHWRGIRRSYLDNDYVPDDDDLKDAVACYVESEVARRVDKDQATADKLYADYRMKAGDIIFREEQDLKPRATRVCVEGLDLSELVQMYPDNNYPTQIGESCATSSAAVQVELQAPVMTLNIDSSPSDIVVEWEQSGTQPETYEIWRSVNGGEFAMVGTVTGDMATYTDTNPMAIGDIWCYKVRGVTGDVQSAFSNEGCALNQYTSNEGGAVSHPTWMLAFGDFIPADSDTVTSLSLPGLLSISGDYLGDGELNVTTVDLSSLINVEGTFYLDGCTSLVSFDLSSLVSVGGGMTFALSTMAVISLPALTTIAFGDLEAGLAPNLTTLSAPVLTFVAGDINCDSTALTSVNLNSFVMLNGRTYAFDNNALPAAMVSYILAIGVASGVASASIFLDGGTSAGLASLSAQGQADYATLFGAGNNITINP